MIDKLEKKFDSATFSKKVEEYVKYQGMCYLDAIMYFCEENRLEIEAVAALVKRSEPIRQKLEAESKASRILGRDRHPSATLDAFQNPA